MTHAELSAAIGQLLGEVWTYLREMGDLAPGHSVVVYRGDPGAGPADVEIGVQIGRDLDTPSASGVRPSELPAGRAVHVTHRGPYDQMAPAYEAIDRWMKVSDERSAGPSWEVYGDWNEDPDLLETDIYFLLA